MSRTTIYSNRLKKNKIMIWKRWNRQAAKRSYRLRYLKKADTVARRGKLVYVRQEYHDRIRCIARVIGGDDVTLFSYIDNVLAQHFEQYREEIEAAYAGKLENLF